MTSGIYELTFSNGDNYIGKSINIENRWKQHFDKFRKGTAARAMQDAFNRYGSPSTKILLTCHADHVDIMESCCIARLSPVLNSGRPCDPFQEKDINYFIHKTDYLSKSTYEHMVTMSNDWDTIEELKSTVEELESLNDDLLVKRSEEEVTYAAGRRIKSLNKTKDHLTKEIIRLEEELEFARLPWWKRWFK